MMQKVATINFNNNVNFKAVKKTAVNRKLQVTAKKARINISKEELVKYVSLGYLIIKIAEVFNCSDTTIKNKLKEYGLKDEYEKLHAKEKSIEEVNSKNIKKYVDEGKTCDEISEILKLSSSEIVSQIDKLGLKPLYDRLHSPQNVEFLKLILQGKSISEIAKNCNMPYSAVNILFHKQGLMSLYKKMHKTYFTKKISEDEIKSLVLKGYSIEKIAHSFKCSSNTVKVYLNKYNLMEQYKEKQPQKEVRKVSEEHLKELVLTGKTGYEISKVLHIDSSRIYHYISTFGLREKYEELHPQKLQKEEVETFIKQGKTIKEIATYYGYDQSSINKFIHKHELMKEYKRIHKNNFAKNFSARRLRGLIQDYYSIEDMANSLKSDVSTIKRYLCKYNLMDEYNKRAGIKTSRNGLYDLINQGKTIAEISDEFCCDEKVVERDLREYGFVEKYQFFQKLKELYSKGVSVNEIAKIFDKSEMYIHRCLQEISSIAKTDAFQVLNYKSDSKSLMETHEKDNMDYESLSQSGRKNDEDLFEKIKEELISDNNSYKSIFSNYLNNHSFINNKVSELVSQKDLSKYIKLGLSVDEMAKELKTERIAIAVALDKYGLVNDYNEKQDALKRVPLYILKNDLELLLREGKSVKEIAQEYHTTKKYVIDMIDKYGLKKIARDSRQSDIENSVGQGNSNIKIANEYKSINPSASQNEKNTIKPKELLEMIKNGVSEKELVKHYDYQYSQEIIHNYMHKYNLLGLYNEIQAERIKEDLTVNVLLGKTIDEISKLYKRVNSKIVQKLEELNLMDKYNEVQKKLEINKSKQVDSSEISKEELKKLISCHQTINDLSIIFNCSEDNIQKLIADFGLLNDYKSMLLDLEKNEKEIQDNNKKFQNIQNLKLAVLQNKTIGEMARNKKVSNETMCDILEEAGVMEVYRGIQGLKGESLNLLQTGRSKENNVELKSYKELYPFAEDINKMAQNGIDLKALTDIFGVPTSSNRSKDVEVITNKRYNAMKNLMINIMQGKTIDEIAKISNKKNSVIIYQIDKFGLKEVYEKAQVKRLTSLIVQGETIGEISKILNQTTGVVCHSIKKHKLAGLYNFVQKIMKKELTISPVAKFNRMPLETMLSYISDVVEMNEKGMTLEKLVDSLPGFVSLNNSEEGKGV